MNVSKHEQRVLHVLAQGGQIRFVRNDNGKVASVTCHTREGHVLTTCTLAVFTRLKRRKLISSRGGRPYRITKLGLGAVRAQPDNR